MSEEIPLIVKREGEILTLSLHNPAKKNALTSEMMGALTAIIEEVESYSGIRVIIIRGEGLVFCSGADISNWNPKELQELLDGIFETEKLEEKTDAKSKSKSKSKS